MPSENFHRLKRDGFRNSGEHLYLHGPADSADSAVQDFFYAALHEVDRFLSLFGYHGGNHRGRYTKIANEKIIQRRGRTIIGDPSHYRNAHVESTVPSSAELYYLTLNAMRHLKAYGSLPTNVPIPPTVGGALFANILEVSTARDAFLRLGNILARHERDLRRRNIL